MVPGRALEPRLAVPRLLRLERREARGEARRRRLPRPGGARTGPGTSKAGQYYLHKLLLAPAGPQPGQPGGARRARAGDGLLARAGAVGLPRRRRAVPDRGRDRRPARAAARPARLRQPPQRRGGAARRGQPARRRTCARSSATRTATSCTWCSTSSATRRSTWRSRAARPSRWRARCATSRRSREAASLGRFVRNHDELTLDKLSDGEREEVFARFGPDPDDAALRPRPAAPAADDARRRPARDPDGLLARVLAARARRCCSTARRSGWPRTSTIEGRYAVRAPMQWSPRTAASRRCDRAAAADGRGRATGPSASTSPPSGATRTRC